MRTLILLLFIASKLHAQPPLVKIVFSADQY